LLQDQRANAAIVPLFNLPPNPDWLQRYYLDHPDAPDSGNCPAILTLPLLYSYSLLLWHFPARDEQDYTLIMTEAGGLRSQTWTLVTLRPEVNQLQSVS